MKIYKDLQQRSPEWFELRKGKMTASSAQAIANSSKGLDTYIWTLMSEYYSKGEPIRYSNDDIERGIALENEAILMFSTDKNVKVERIGFVLTDEYTGFSPDGFTGDDSTIEVKCPNDKNYFRILINGENEIDTAYLWQIQMGLLLSGRKYCWLLFYNPNFERDLVIFRIEADPEKQEKIKMGIVAGRKLIDKIKKLYSK